MRRVILYGLAGRVRLTPVAAGVIGFGKAFQVGILITLVTCGMYVIAWEITYFNFFPDFLDQYSAHSIAKMRAAGESEAAIREATAEMADFAKLYANPLFNVASPSWRCSRSGSS